jgi:hypothetical protein
MYWFKLRIAAIDELFIIVGPNIGSYMSHDDSYIENEDGRDEPYDPSNMYRYLRKLDKA